MDAIYARQSVDKADSLSIQGQIDLCRHQTGEAVEVYQDKGYSGKNTNRPAFRRLMEDVEKGQVQKIVVYRLDRFSRSIADFGRLWETLEKHRVGFVSINETFDTATPMGRAMLNIIMVFAQLERETTAERVRDNYYQRAALGAWPGGPAPYGFTIGRLPCATGKLMPALIPDREKAEVVQRIFDAYSEPGMSLGSVARALNAEGIAAPKRAAWDNVTLSRLLHSPLYAMADQDIYFYYKGKGLLITNGLEEFDGLHSGMIVGRRNRTANKYNDLQDQHFSLANHFGLVPSDVWLQCQYKLERNRQLGGNGRGKHTWLSGLLKCAECGYSVKVNRDGEKYYLVCSGRSNLGLCDQSIRVELRELEDSIATEVEKLLSECPDLDQDDTAGGRKTAEAAAKLDRKINRLMEALAESDDLSMKYINRELSRLDGERQGLINTRTKKKARPKRNRTDRLVFELMDFEQKKLVAAQFIREVSLAGDTADIIWNI